MKRIILPIPCLLLLGSLVFPQVKVGTSVKIGSQVKVAGAGATNFVNDTLTDTDTTLLSSHTGELGAGWTQHASYTTATITIQTNRAHKDTSPGTACYYASGTPANANYSVEGTMVDLTSTTRTSAVCGWIDTATNTMVCIRRASSTSIELIKIINGTVTTGLASTTVTYTQDLLRTYTVTRSGTSYTGNVDGASFGPVTISDTELSNAGRVGIRQTGAWPADSTYPVSSIRAYQ